MLNSYRNISFSEYRALYRSRGLRIENCRFDGSDDGEDILLESTDIIIKDCYFNLPYPLWHSNSIYISHIEMTEHCRGPVWYSSNVNISDSQLHGPKAFRECSGISIKKCDIISPEFGWYTHGVDMNDCKAVGEYFLMQADNIRLEKVCLSGKYSFQYIKDSFFSDCVFDSKDIFWHAKNVTLKNCTLNGDFPVWYSDNITLENCTITGEMPFYSCKNLKLINCRMLDTEDAFEKSEVEADITTVVTSIVNPKSGYIRAAGVKEIIMDDPDAKAEIITE